MNSLSYESESNLFNFAKSAKKMVALLTAKPVVEKDVLSQWKEYNAKWIEMDWCLRDAMEDR